MSQLVIRLHISCIFMDNIASIELVDKNFPSQKKKKKKKKKGISRGEGSIGVKGSNSKNFSSNPFRYGIFTNNK